MCVKSAVWLVWKNRKDIQIIPECVSQFPSVFNKLHPQLSQLLFLDPIEQVGLGIPRKDNTRFACNNLYRLSYISSQIRRNCLAPKYREKNS